MIALRNDESFRLICTGIKIIDRFCLLTLLDYFFDNYQYLSGAHRLVAGAGLDF